MENSLPQLLHAVAMLGLVLALIGALAWGLRRWQGLETAQGKEGWRVRRRLPLTAQHSLVEVEDNGKIMLFLLGPHGGQVVNCDMPLDRANKKLHTKY